jgi:hypothetical protein
MFLLSINNEHLANISFKSKALLLESQKILSHYVFIPLIDDYTPHKRLQDFYYYIEKQVETSGWFVKGVEERFINFFIPYNNDGILDFENILCYPLKHCWDKSGLEAIDQELQNCPNLRVKIKFDPIELIQLASCFVKKRYGE